MHANILRRYACLLALITVCLQGYAQEKTSKTDFLRIAKYLASGSGSWRTPNPGYNPQNPQSAKEFELKFSLDLRGNLLHLVHYAHRKGDSRITSESYWLWHPGEQTIKYYSIDLSGDFTDGRTYMTALDAFYTVEYRYNTDGKIELKKDSNTIVSESEHIVKTSVLKQGKWQLVATYTLKKQD